MANIFEQYGIKEVADVMIYKLEEDSEGITQEIPYLFLDTLKVSTLEQTAEQTEARGGKGNSPLIIWDFGKEINITLEDALYSPRSMGMTWGGNKEWESITTIEKTIQYTAKDSTVPKKFKIYNPVTNNEEEVTPSTTIWYKTTLDANETLAQASMISTKDGNTYTDPATLKPNETYFVTITVNTVQAKSSKLVITADDFPGTYKIVGDTYARNRDTGKDEFFQFIVHRAKMSAENTLTLEAEGDPTVFNLNLRTLRPKDGKMLELIQYQLGE
jgi:hypothetical protein